MPNLEGQMSPMIPTAVCMVRTSMPPFLYLLSILEGERTDSLRAWLHNGDCPHCNPQAELTSWLVGAGRGEAQGQESHTSIPSSISWEMLVLR